MADYTGYVEVIGQLIPKNKANFKVVDANDISVHGKDSGISLESILENVDSPIKDYVQTQIAGSSFGGNTVINKVLLMLGLDSNGDPKDTSGGSGSSSGDGESTETIYDYINNKINEESSARNAQIDSLTVVNGLLDVYVSDKRLTNSTQVDNKINTKISELYNLSPNDVDTQISNKLAEYMTSDDVRSIAKEEVLTEATSRETVDARLASRLDIVESKLGSVSGTVVIVNNISEMVDRTVVYWNKEDNMWYYFDAEDNEFIIGGQIGGIEMDTSLEKAGYAADSKTVGDKFNSTNESITSIISSINTASNRINALEIKNNHIDISNNYNEYAAVEVDKTGNNIISYIDNNGNKYYTTDIYSPGILAIINFINNIDNRLKILEGVPQV